MCVWAAQWHTATQAIPEPPTLPGTATEAIPEPHALSDTTKEAVTETPSLHYQRLHSSLSYRRLPGSLNNRYFLGSLYCRYRPGGSLSCLNHLGHTLHQPLISFQCTYPFTPWTYYGSRPLLLGGGCTVTFWVCVLPAFLFCSCLSFIFSLLIC